MDECERHCPDLQPGGIGEESGPDYGGYCGHFHHLLAALLSDVSYSFYLYLSNAGDPSF